MHNIRWQPAALHAVVDVMNGVGGVDLGLQQGTADYIIIFLRLTTMPKIRTARSKAPPEGFEEIEEVHSC